MSWRIACRDGQYRLWSTISDEWLTDWESKESIQHYIADEYLFEHKKRIIKLYLQFPHHSMSMDGKYLLNEDGHQAYGKWLEALTKIDDPDIYIKHIEQKYNEIMQTLEKSREI